MDAEKVIKALEWLIFNFPKQENPEDDSDRLCNCINLYCQNAVDLIKWKQAEIERLQEIANPKCQQCVEQTRKNSFIEFADLFKQQMRDCASAEFDGIKYYLIGEEFVNRRLKELTEGSNGCN